MFHPNSKTIRLMPGNFEIAFEKFGRWVVDPDQEVPYLLRMELFSIVTQFHTIRWGNGDSVAWAFNQRIPKEEATGIIDNPAS